MDQPVDVSKPQAAPTVKEALDHYKAFRDYIQHEDMLVNQRITWLITLHGFLYASLAITIQKVVEIQLEGAQTRFAPPHSVFPIFFDPGARIELFIYFIALVGLFVAIAVQQSIDAARNSANAVFFLSKLDHSIFKVEHEKTKFYFLQRRCANGELVNLPWIIGGGVSHAPRFGNFSSKYIPLIIIVSWTTIILLNSVFAMSIHYYIPKMTLTIVSILMLIVAYAITHVRIKSLFFDIKPDEIEVPKPSEMDRS